MRVDRSIDVPFRTQQFVALAVQTGSFHKAARTLGIHAAVISRSVHRLETELGFKLFDRSRNHFSVTPAGERFVGEIIEAVAHVERACDLGRYTAQIEHGPLRIGYSAYIHSRLVPLLEELTLESSTTWSESGENPGIDVASRPELECGTTLQLVERVERGSLHAALGVVPVRGEHLTIYPIMHEPFSLGLSKNHPLAKQPAVPAKDLDGEPLFLFPRRIHPLLHDHITDYIESTGARPVIHEVMSLAHAVEIVSHNIGVALLPRSAASLSAMGVLFKPVSDKLLSMETALFYCHDRHDNRLPLLIRTLQSQIRRLIPER